MSGQNAASATPSIKQPSPSRATQSVSKFGRLSGSPARPAIAIRHWWLLDNGRSSFRPMPNDIQDDWRLAVGLQSGGCHRASPKDVQEFAVGVTACVLLRCRTDQSSIDACPFDSTNRSRLGQIGS